MAINLLYFNMLYFNNCLVRQLLQFKFLPDDLEVKFVAYVISDECISCGACEPECPVEAISEEEDKFHIDPDICIDCGACEPVCPVEAISPE